MEKNSNTLIEAIGRLPEYQPPDVLWQDIMEQLDFDQSVNISLRDMPVYAPSAALWEHLVVKMEQLPELKPKPTLRPMFRWLIMLSVLLLISIVVFQMLKPEPTTTKQQVPPPTPELLKTKEPIAQSQSNRTKAPVKTTVRKYPKT